jgi:hypothetical protein
VRKNSILWFCRILVVVFSIFVCFAILLFSHVCFGKTPKNTKTTKLRKQQKCEKRKRTKKPQYAVFRIFALEQHPNKRETPHYDVFLHFGVFRTSVLFALVWVFFQRKSKINSILLFFRMFFGKM